MAKENMFEQIFSPIGQGMRGIARGLFPGAASAADLDRQKIQAILKSEKGQRLLLKAREVAISEGRDYWGRDRGDPWVKGSEDLGKIRAAKDKFSEDELSPETAAYFDAAEKSVLDRMKRDNREYFAPQDETDVFEALGKKKEAPTGIDPIDRAIGLAGGRKTLPKVKKKGELDVFEGMGAPQIADYFQASTETVPQGNIPKTYPQMGIESVDDMSILSEMQKALPDIDMKNEYESDPEMMQKLMELWRAKKLTKQNLHKAFSVIQQSAQQALGR